MTPPPFRLALRRAIANRAMTVRQAARHIGISPRTVESWLQGARTPKPLMAAAVLEKLAV